jgi:hypothetical protein
MSNRRNQPLVRQARRCAIGIGMAAAAVVAAGMISIATAYADDGDDVLGQAGADLTQATQVLDGAPEASLDAQQAALLAGQESIQTGSESSILADQESIQSALPLADQTELTGVDDQLAQAYQGVLDADQAFVAADEAGDLSSGQGLLPADLGVIDADFGVLPADFNAVVADIGADVASFFDMSSFLP